METAKNKIIEKINTSYQEILSIHKELNEGYSKVNPNELEDRLSLGTKMLLLSELNIKLDIYVEVLTNVLQGTLQELPTDVVSFYEELQSLKRPPQEQDSEQVKAIKEMIKSYKNAQKN